MLSSTLFMLIAIIVLLFGTTIFCVATLIRKEPVHDVINARLDAGESIEDINKDLGRA